MQYYKDNEFEEIYIDAYRKQITDLWNNEYKPKGDENNNQPTQQNTLAAHMFKKRKTIYDDELEEYLNEPPANFDTDVLTFWKVKLII